MPRATRDTNSRGSRNWGKMSGVSILTHPSGVSINQNTIDMGSGVSLNATSLIHTSQGYPIYEPTLNNINIKSGTTQTGGTSRYMSATMLGLNTVTNFICQVLSGTSGANIRAGASVFTMTAFDHAANTGVTVFMFKQTSGASQTTGVSLAYIAVGT